MKSERLPKAESVADEIESEKGSGGSKKSEKDQNCDKRAQRNKCQSDCKRRKQE